MKQVTKDEFFKLLNDQKLDIIPKTIRKNINGEYAGFWEIRGTRELFAVDMPIPYGKRIVNGEYISSYYYVKE